MKTYLITGAAGFIGANFIKYMLAKYPEIKIVVLDLLTYAGNLGTIAEDIDGERCEFVKGNICDRALTDELFAKYQFDYVVTSTAWYISRQRAMWTAVSRIRSFFWSRIY